VDKPRFRKNVIVRSVKESSPLFQLLPEDYRDRILKEVGEWAEEIESAVPAEKQDPSQPTTKLTSFEASKGLSAQHVFILGFQDGELPRDNTNITDLEICKLIVTLTRVPESSSQQGYYHPQNQ